MFIGTMDSMWGRTPRVLETSQTLRYRLTHGPTERYVGIVTGNLRRTRCAQVWVNPENTAMRMARVEELSVSAIIRYEGGRHDRSGRLTADLINDELERKAGPFRPVPPGTVILTGSGELARFGVRHIAHVAAVQGELGAGFHQVREVGRCVTAVLTAIDRLADPDPDSASSLLFPLLGAGQGGGQPAATAKAIVGATIDYLATTPDSRVNAVYLLAYTDRELAACQVACRRRGLREVPGGSSEPIAQDPGTVEVRPTAESSTHRILQLGFAVDVVGYGGRTAPDREAVQHRLVTLLRRALADAGIDLDLVDPVDR